MTKKEIVLKAWHILTEKSNSNGIETIPNWEKIEKENIEFNGWPEEIIIDLRNNDVYYNGYYEVYYEEGIERGNMYFRISKDGSITKLDNFDNIPNAEDISGEFFEDVTDFISDLD